MALSFSAEANTQINVKNGSTNLTVSASYDAPTPTPAPGTTNDVTFKAATTYSPTTFNLGAGAAATLSIGTLNDLDSTQALTITNAGNNNTTDVIQLNGGTDSVSGSAAGDLIFLASNANLTIMDGLGNRFLQLALLTDGNFDVSSGATLTISSAITGNFNLTKTGTGTLTLSGTNTFGSGKVFELSAGTLNINSATALGAGTFQIDNGTTINNTTNTAITISNNNPITINGDFTFTGTKSLNLGTGATSLGTASGTTRTITVSANTLTIGGAISNGTTANSLTKGGNGTLVLTGASTYSGGTTVNTGSLFVNNTSGSGTGSGAVVVNNSGTLGGSGTISGSVTLNNSAKISAGASANTVGTLNTGALTLNNTSIFSADIASAVSFDQVSVTGLVTLANTSVLQVQELGGFMCTAGQMFTLINNDGTDAIVGTFANAPTNGSILFVGSDSFYVNYDGGTGNDLVLTCIPETSTWFGGALVLAALGYTQRKRFAKKLSAEQVLKRT